MICWKITNLHGYYGDLNRGSPNSTHIHYIDAKTRIQDLFYGSNCSKPLN